MKPRSSPPLGYNLGVTSKRPGHVVVVNDNAYVQGGAAKVAIASARLLAEAGVNVTFFAAAGPIDPLLQGLDHLKTVLVYDEPEYDVTKLGGITHAVRGLWDKEAQKKMTRLLRSLNPHDTVVHAHMVREQLTASVLKPVLDEDFPFVMTPHEYNLGCPYGGFFNYTEGKRCDLRGLSVKCMLCRCNDGAYIRKLWFYTKGKGQQLVAGVPGRVKHFIFISKFSQQRLEPYLPQGAIKHFVRNPIEIVDEGRKELDPQSPFVFIGRMTIEKDPVIFARVAQRLGVRAVFIGDGPLRAKVLEANPNAELMGWMGREEVKTWMMKARALVFPSIWFEGQPLTVQEAEAVGLPTITSDACAPSNYVVDGETGIVFEASQDDSLEVAMVRLMDDSEAERMSKNCYERFWSDPPTPEAHLRDLLAVYEEVLA